MVTTETMITERAINNISSTALLELELCIHFVQTVSFTLVGALSNNSGMLISTDGWTGLWPRKHNPKAT